MAFNNNGNTSNHLSRVSTADDTYTTFNNNSHGDDESRTSNNSIASSKKFYRKKAKASKTTKRKSCDESTGAENFDENAWINRSRLYGKYSDANLQSIPSQVVRHIPVKGAKLYGARSDKILSRASTHGSESTIIINGGNIEIAKAKDQCLKKKSKSFDATGKMKFLTEDDRHERFNHALPDVYRDSSCNDIDENECDFEEYLKYDLNSKNNTGSRKLYDMDKNGKFSKNQNYLNKSWLQNGCRIQNSTLSEEHGEEMTDDEDNSCRVKSNKASRNLSKYSGNENRLQKYQFQNENVDPGKQSYEIAKTHLKKHVTSKNYANIKRQHYEGDRRNCDDDDDDADVRKGSFDFDDEYLCLPSCGDDCTKRSQLSNNQNARKLSKSDIDEISGVSSVSSHKPISVIVSRRMNFQAGAKNQKPDLPKFCSLDYEMRGYNGIDCKRSIPRRFSDVTSSGMTSRANRKSENDIDRFDDKGEWKESEKEEENDGFKDWENPNGLPGKTHSNIPNLKQFKKDGAHVNSRHNNNYQESCTTLDEHDIDTDDDDDNDGSADDNEEEEEEEEEDGCDLEKTKTYFRDIAPVRMVTASNETKIVHSKSIDDVMDGSGESRTNPGFLSARDLRAKRNEQGNKPAGHFVMMRKQEKNVRRDYNISEGKQKCSRSKHVNSKRNTTDDDEGEVNGTSGLLCLSNHNNRCFQPLMNDEDMSRRQDQLKYNTKPFSQQEPIIFTPRDSFEQKLPFDFDGRCGLCSSRFVAEEECFDRRDEQFFPERTGNNIVHHCCPNHAKQVQQQQGQFQPQLTEKLQLFQPDEKQFVWSEQLSSYGNCDQQERQQSMQEQLAPHQSYLFSKQLVRSEEENEQRSSVPQFLQMNKSVSDHHNHHQHHHLGATQQRPNETFRQQIGQHWPHQQQQQLPWQYGRTDQPPCCHYCHHNHAGMYRNHANYLLHQLKDRLKRQKIMDDTKTTETLQCSCSKEQTAEKKENTDNNIKTCFLNSSKQEQTAKTKSNESEKSNPESGSFRVPTFSVVNDQSTVTDGGQGHTLFEDYENSDEKEESEGDENTEDCRKDEIEKNLNEVEQEERNQQRDESSRRLSDHSRKATSSASHSFDNLYLGVIQNQLSSLKESVQNLTDAFNQKENKQEDMDVTGRNELMTDIVRKFSQLLLENRSLSKRFNQLEKIFADSLGSDGVARCVFNIHENETEEDENDQQDVPDDAFADRSDLIAKTGSAQFSKEQKKIEEKFNKDTNCDCMADTSDNIEPRFSEVSASTLGKYQSFKMCSPNDRTENKGGSKLYNQNESEMKNETILKEGFSGHFVGQVGGAEGRINRKVGDVNVLGKEEIMCDDNQVDPRIWDCKLYLSNMGKSEQSSKNNTTESILKSSQVGEDFSSLNSKSAVSTTQGQRKSGKYNNNRGRSLKFSVEPSRHTSKARDGSRQPTSYLGTCCDRFKLLDADHTFARSDIINGASGSQNNPVEFTPMSFGSLMNNSVNRFSLNDDKRSAWNEASNKCEHVGAHCRFFTENNEKKRFSPCERFSTNWKCEDGVCSSEKDAGLDNRMHLMLSVLGDSKKLAEGRLEASADQTMVYDSILADFKNNWKMNNTMTSGTSSHGSDEKLFCSRTVDSGSKCCNFVPNLLKYSKKSKLSNVTQAAQVKSCCSNRPNAKENLPKSFRNYFAAANDSQTDESSYVFAGRDDATKPKKLNNTNINFDASLGVDQFQDKVSSNNTFHSFAHAQFSDRANPPVYSCKTINVDLDKKSRRNDSAATSGADFRACRSDLVDCRSPFMTNHFETNNILSRSPNLPESTNSDRKFLERLKVVNHLSSFDGPCSAKLRNSERKFLERLNGVNWSSFDGPSSAKLRKNTNGRKFVLHSPENVHQIFREKKTQSSSSSNRGEKQSMPVKQSDSNLASNDEALEKLSSSAQKQNTVNIVFNDGVRPAGVSENSWRESSQGNRRSEDVSLVGTGHPMMKKCLNVKKTNNINVNFSNNCSECDASDRPEISYKTKIAGDSVPIFYDRINDEGERFDGCRGNEKEDEEEESESVDLKIKDRCGLSTDDGDDDDDGGSHFDLPLLSSRRLDRVVTTASNETTPMEEYIECKNDDIAMPTVTESCIDEECTTSCVDDDSDVSTSKAASKDDGANNNSMEQVYKEVSSFISANESRTQYLTELFKNLKMLTSQDLRLKAVSALNLILSEHSIGLMDVSMGETSNDNDEEGRGDYFITDANKKIQEAETDEQKTENMINSFDTDSLKGDNLTLPLFAGDPHAVERESTARDSDDETSYNSLEGVKTAMTYLVDNPGFCSPGFNVARDEDVNVDDNGDGEGLKRELTDMNRGNTLDTDYHGDNKAKCRTTPVEDCGSNSELVRSSADSDEERGGIDADKFFNVCTDHVEIEESEKQETSQCDSDTDDDDGDDGDDDEKSYDDHGDDDDNKEEVDNGADGGQLVKEKSDYEDCKGHDDDEEEEEDGADFNEWSNKSENSEEKDSGNDADCPEESYSSILKRRIKVLVPQECGEQQKFLTTGEEEHEKSVHSNDDSSVAASDDADDGDDDDDNDKSESSYKLKKADNDESTESTKHLRNEEAGDKTYEKENRSNNDDYDEEECEDVEEDLIKGFSDNSYDDDDDEFKSKCSGNHDGRFNIPALYEDDEDYDCGGDDEATEERRMFLFSDRCSPEVERDDEIFSRKEVGSIPDPANDEKEEDNDDDDDDVDAEDSYVKKEEKNKEIVAAESFDRKNINTNLNRESGYSNLGQELDATASILDGSVPQESERFVEEKPSDDDDSEAFDAASKKDWTVEDSESHENKMQSDEVELNANEKSRTHHRSFIVDKLKQISKNFSLTFSERLFNDSFIEDDLPDSDLQNQDLQKRLFAGEESKQSVSLPQSDRSTSSSSIDCSLSQIDRIPFFNKSIDDVLRHLRHKSKADHPLDVFISMKKNHHLNKDDVDDDNDDDDGGGDDDNHSGDSSRISVVSGGCAQYNDNNAVASEAGRGRTNKKRDDIYKGNRKSSIALVRNLSRSMQTSSEYIYSNDDEDSGDAYTINEEIAELLEEHDEVTSPSGRKTLNMARVLTSSEKETQMEKEFQGDLTISTLSDLVSSQFSQELAG